MIVQGNKGQAMGEYVVLLSAIALALVLMHVSIPREQWLSAAQQLRDRMLIESRLLNLPF